MNDFQLIHTLPSGAALVAEGRPRILRLIRPEPRVAMAIRCLSCSHLKRWEPSMGQSLARCERGHFGQGNGLQLCHELKTLLSPPQDLQRIAAECDDFQSPEEVEL